MKTERELFLEWLKKEYPMMYQWYSDGLEEWKTKVEYMFVAWQARVPEGYVVVPKEPSAELVNHGHQVFLGHFNEGGQTGGRSLYFAYKAMLEAVEK